MNKFYLSCCAVLLCYACTAAETASNTNRLSLFEILEQRTDLKLKSGGFVKTPIKGRFAFLVNPNVGTNAFVSELAASFSGKFKFPITVTRLNTAFSLNAAKEMMAGENADVAVFICADPALPMSLVSLEGCWAMVNAEKVLNRKVDAQAGYKRLRKELARVFKALFSAASTAPGVRVAVSGDDLDLINSDSIDGQTLVNIVHGLPSYGLKASRIVTYRQACMEGWAAQPTNEIQKTVWNDVYKAPSKPIKIKYDANKQPAK